MACRTGPTGTVFMLAPVIAATSRAMPRMLRQSPRVGVGFVVSNWSSRSSNVRMSVPARASCANQCNRNLDALAHIGRAADNSKRWAPGADLAYRQAVGAGMLFDLEHFPHHHAIERRRGRLQRLDLDAAH